jgi:CPA1 family monovalent cation:H+ antiporter
MSQAEVAMARVQLKLLEQRAYAADGTLIHPQLLERYRHRSRVSENYAGNEERYQPHLQQHFDLVLEAVTVARAELVRLHRAGMIDDRVLRELEHDLDLEELSAHSAKAT